MSVNGIGMNSAISGTSEASYAIKQNLSRPTRVVGDDSVSNEKIRKQVVEMQRQISTMNVGLAFTTYGNHGENIAVVVADKETGEVIREIPAKEIQHLHDKMSELIGMILNGQA